jgi:uncharacterized protein YcbK (DUF882 family)
MDWVNVFGPHFEASEFGISDHSPDSVRENIYLLCKFALNPVRAKYGPVKITSGYRTPEQNEALRMLGKSPAADSQHIHGQAVDFICPQADTHEVFKWLSTWWTGQCFYETKQKIIHIALPTIRLEAAKRLYCTELDI